MSSTPEFVDECTLHAKGGDGGHGVVAFRKEAHVPRGGPDGGDGGAGGNVLLLADRNTTSLLDVHRNPHRRAGDGQPGSGNNRTGARGKDKVVKVPVGTVVRDHTTGEVIGDLVRDGQRFVVAPGGRGGRGNAAFANRFRRIPKFCEFGEAVEDRTLRLELKLIADVGLVGYPSAGKSSLIGRVSNAKPRVEAWHFTTLTPHLGLVRAGGDDAGNPIDIVMADVPGLIEGAAEGKGLGHQFLRHIERCHVLLHVVDTVPFDTDRDPVHDVEVMREELRKHEPTLLERPQVVALNKIDVPDGRAMAELTRTELEDRGFEVFDISAVSGEGIDPLLYRLGALVSQTRPAVDSVESEQEIVLRLRPKGDGFTVEHDAETDTYVVEGTTVRRWVQMLDLANREAVRYLQGRLRRAGVDRALVDAGARDGDAVAIGDVVFDFEPELKDLPAEEREAILAAEAADEEAEHDAEEAYLDWRDEQGFEDSDDGEVVTWESGA